MKPHHFHIGIAALTLILAGSPAIAQSSLKIPRTSDEMRDLLEKVDHGCSSCGVVTDITELQGTNNSNSTNVSRPGTDAGPGPGVRTTPIISSKTDGQSNSRWRVTVRYDNGQYAAFEQVDPPTVVKGDNIRVITDRVELR